jgi:hypothetical protein
VPAVGDEWVGVEEEEADVSGSHGGSRSRIVHGGRRLAPGVRGSRDRGVRIEIPPFETSFYMIPLFLKLLS